jgi:hypothetical protein
MSERLRNIEDINQEDEDGELNARLLEEELAERGRDEMDDLGRSDSDFAQRIREGFKSIEIEEECANDFLYNVTKDTAEYIRAGNFKSVVLLDRSARPFSTALSTYWELAYKDEKMPQIYFLNPEALKKPRTKDDLTEKFKEEHPYLFKDKDEHVFVFDVCAHSGSTISDVKSSLGRVGFSNLSFGLVFDTRKDDEKKANPIDFTIDYNDKNSNCYMFGQSDFLAKGDKLHVDITDSEKREKRLQDLAVIFETTLRRGETFFENPKEVMVFARMMMHEKGATKEDVRSLIRRKERDAEWKGFEDEEWAPLTDENERKEAVEKRKRIKKIIESKFLKENE